MTTKKADEKPRQQKLKKPPKWIEVIDNELIKSEAGSAETKGVSGHDTEKEHRTDMRKVVTTLESKGSLCVGSSPSNPSEMSGKKLYLVGMLLTESEYHYYKMVGKIKTEITPEELELLKEGLWDTINEWRESRDIYAPSREIPKLKALLKRLEGMSK